ncbi:MAG TPA: GNAT family N-acetyltransferase [Pseudonocardiaceae bacterium]|nr:GNAT family N-acetyltransferase [Pseudonocardiaceae bacterium]
MTADELPIRTATPDDWGAISRLLSSAFNEAFDEERNRVEHGIYEPERCLVATDGADVVANAGVFTRDLTVPGAVVPAAHVTMVGVAPTHRRRGLLRRLMGRQLRDVRAAGESLALLWASEARIYQRYGYGLATAKLSLEIDTREVRLPPAASVAGRLRGAEPASARNELAKVYEQLRAERPGYSSRDERWWAYVLADVASRRHGGTERRALLHDGPAGMDGYALWRAKPSWDWDGPRGEVQVDELMATTLESYVALWRFLLSVDLTRTTHYWFGAVDEPLLHLVNEPRRLGGRLGDGLWVRLTDVAAALAARRYAAAVDVVFEVTDELLPENAGRWRLVADASGAQCRRTGDPADLACDVSALGAVYLGGPSLGALAAAGRVRELRPGTLAGASTAFGWHRAPSAVEIF